MKLDSLQPTYADYIGGSRVLFNGGDIWKDDFDGVPHRHISWNGNLLSVKVPTNIPMKYKGRKLSRLVVYCNACELVTGIEAFYIRPAVGGYALAFRDPESITYVDVSDQFK